MRWLELSLHLHVAGGSLALAAMLVPLFSRKGGAAHRRFGWLFVAGMALTCVTGAVASGEAIARAQGAHDRDFPIFLFCLSIFTAGLVSIGVRSIRTRRRAGASRSAWDLGLATLSLAAAAVTLVYGLARGRNIFVGFGFVAVPLCSVQLRYWLRAPRSKVHHILQHIVGMLGCCIAGLTALLVINSGHFGLTRAEGALWSAPALVLGPLMLGWLLVTQRRATDADAPAALEGPL